MSSQAYMYGLQNSLRQRLYWCSLMHLCVVYKAAARCAGGGDYLHNREMQQNQFIDKS